MRISFLLVSAGVLSIACTEKQPTSTRGALPSDREYSVDTVLIDHITTNTPIRSSTVTLSEKYPGDIGMANDPAVLFHDDFELGWGKWDTPGSNTKHLYIEKGTSLANGGSAFLRSTVTKKSKYTRNV